MAENGEQSLDLAKILATLANLPKPDAQSYQGQPAYEHSQGYQGHREPQQQYIPEQNSHYQQPADPRLIGRSLPQHRQPHPKPQDRVSSPLIDPSTITEWKQGLRCLMKDQDSNVKSWEAGRKNLIEEHKFKRENERTHRAALYDAQPFFAYGNQISSPTINTDEAQTPEREKEELDQYDAKVYRACKAMVDSQTSSLKALGVPFFGVKPHLVVGSSYDPAEVTDSQSTPAGSKITKDQLLELQRKMLNHLMELYGD
ncbi:chromatin remodeling complex subunit [Stemphylium lycopersici]|uniref:Chromatin remodeling complex subunit n=1 Tax=Stemphylium lycopersici TaxID=183478 RepID=A0A364ND10_STELY|nr:chromatin remodeling complex subunit [Stemphylium lycopersici]RAR15077.1 chromatin remodeling complex subunit [Stemphylium lycopersici]